MFTQSAGDSREPPHHLDDLMPALYAELRSLAERALRDERADHTLRPSALVNEVYLRLQRDGDRAWKTRAHFFASASQAIRRILIEHARKHRAQKRSGLRARVPLSDVIEAGEADKNDLLAIHDSIEALAEFDPRMSRVVELRFFGGLSVEEVALILGHSKRTIEGDWTMARAWLRRRLAGDPAP